MNKATNFLKCICAYLVIFSHSYTIAQNLPDPLSQYSHGIIDFGGIAVSVFFFFSGYYITKSIMKNGTEKFFRKRFSRLLPSLIVVILVTIFLLGPIFTTLSITQYFSNKNTYLYLLNCVFIPVHSLPGVFENNIFGSTINGALWTLSVEMLSYLYLYLVKKFHFLHVRKYLFIFVATILLCFIGDKLFCYLNLEILSSMIRPFLIFATSIFISLYEEKITCNLKFLIFAILLFVCLIFLRDIVFMYVAMVGLFPYILYVFITLFKKCTLKIGLLEHLSYQIYLVGFPIQQVLVYLNGGDMNIFLNFTMSALLSTLFAYILYKIETHILAFKCVKRMI